MFANIWKTVVFVTVPLTPTLAAAEFSAVQDALDVCGGYSDLHIGERANTLISRGWTELDTSPNREDAARLSDISAHFSVNDPTASTGFGKAHERGIGEIRALEPDADSVVRFTRILQKGDTSGSLVVMTYEPMPSTSKCVFVTTADAPYGAMIDSVTKYGRRFSLPFVEGVELISDPTTENGTIVQTSVLAVEPKAKAMSEFLGEQRPQSHGSVSVTRSQNQ